MPTTTVKYLDDNGLTYYHSKIKTLLNGKVDTEAGKGLSANDFTNTLKSKLDGIAAGAQVNVIEGVNVNGSAVTPTNKIVNLTIPTKLTDLTNDGNFVTDANYVHTDNNFTTTLKNKLNGIATGAEVNVQSDWAVTSTSSDAFIKNKPTKVSDFTNDSNFQTQSQVQQAINDAIGQITGLSFEIVQTLPATGTAGTIYLVPNSVSAPNIYDEYVWVTSGGSGSFEKIGTTDVDLTNYVQFSNLVAITNSEIDTIVA
jgi:hypothetical protein